MQSIPKTCQLFVFLVDIGREQFSTWKTELTSYVQILVGIYIILGQIPLQNAGIYIGY